MVAAITPGAKRSKGGLLAMYIRALESNPILTKAITNACLGFLEELSSTYFANKKTGKPVLTPNTMVRSFKMMGYAGLVSAPLGHFLFDLVEKLFVGSTGAMSTVLKLLVTNVGVVPIQTYVYLYAMARFEGLDMVRAHAKAMKNLFATVQMSWMIFPAVQLIAFRYLPPTLWVPFFNIIGFVFGVYINANSK